MCANAAIIKSVWQINLEANFTHSTRGVGMPTHGLSPQTILDTIKLIIKTEKERETFIPLEKCRRGYLSANLPRKFPQTRKTSAGAEATHRNRGEAPMRVSAPSLPRGIRQIAEGV